MEKFNEIALQAGHADDSFYVQRGIKIHSLEVTRYACADRAQPSFSSRSLPGDDKPQTA